MARYKALRKGYPDKQVEPGEEFDWAGEPGSWMEPLDDEAKERFAARFGADAKPKGGLEDRRPIGAAPVGSKPTNPETIALKAHIASLEALVLKLSQGASDKTAPAVSEIPASPAGGVPPSPPAGTELAPEVAAAMEKRRARGAQTKEA
jgi:hypothetical protein